MNDVDLIISANGCTDNTWVYLNYLQSVVPNLKVIWDDEALGYSKANNLAIEEASCDKIVLLNNDTVLLEQNKNQWLEILDGPFSDPDCGISCIIKGYSEPANHYFAVFFCVMIHRKVFDKIGLLNEEYGVGGGEDTEFCIEAERAGFKVLEVFEKLWSGEQYTGGFPIYHKGEGTMHNPELVANWDKVFTENSLKLANKYNDKNIKDSLSWMNENGEEAKELYKEVITENIYGISRYSLKDRDVIDIGANMGTFSIFASKLGANKVVAVEPVSDTIRVFKMNMQKADVTNIILKQNIASDESGKMMKMALQEKCGHNSAYTESDNYEEVETTTLKDLLESTNKNNVFLKMDCEGGEYDVLLTVDPQDMQAITTIAIEIHGDLHPEYKGVSIIQQKLTNLGYERVSHKQIGTWNVDEFGNTFNYRDLPLTNEIWQRA